MTIKQFTKWRYPKVHKQILGIIESGHGSFKIHGQVYTYHPIERNGSPTNWGVFIREDGCFKVELVNKKGASYQLFVSDARCTELTEGLHNDRLGKVPQYVRKAVLDTVYEHTHALTLERV